MPTITVKNVPPELYEELKRMAQANRRSINSEVIVCIERAVRNRPLDTAAVLARARALRRLTADHPLTDEAITSAKQFGRP
ncbi:MAG: Arc family DNA-binding protein [Chloroflexi bacterium]|nr:Arc family DNA-binding protein [Chloroflexota bacterium]